MQLMTDLLPTDIIDHIADLFNDFNLITLIATPKRIDEIYIRLKHKISYSSACVKGHLRVIKYMYLRGEQLPTTISIFDIAAEFGQLLVMKWLWRHVDHKNLPYSTNAMDIAAANGHLEVVKWLHQNTALGCTTDAMDYAAGNGNFEVLIWLHYNRWEGCTTLAMDTAAEHGHLDIVKWLHKYRTEGCTRDAVDNAISNKFLLTAKWLIQHRSEGCSNRALDMCIAIGNYHFLRWMCKNQSVKPSFIGLHIAVRNGYTDMLEFIYKLIGNFYSNIYSLAANYSRMDVLEWCFKKRIPGYSLDILIKAVENGYLRYDQFERIRKKYKL